jgi:predicted small lipoprotein YifL
MAALALAAVVSLAACGESTPDAAPADVPAEKRDRDGSDRPPATRPQVPKPPTFRVRYGDDFVDLRPWTYCYANICADGFPPANPPDVGSPEQVVIEFPLAGWSVRADFEVAGKTCGRRFPAETEEVAPGRFVLRPAGYAGEYDVTLSGRGPGGDAYTTFRWTTPTDGPLPTPSSYVSIIAGHDGAIGSYGIELSVSQLAEKPERADATITVTAADGDALTIAPRLDQSACGADGSLYWEGSRAQGEQAAGLGPAPFTYDVELVLDGRTYEAHATWPDDAIPVLAPAVRLHFSPDLPALH